MEMIIDVKIKGAKKEQPIQIQVLDLKLVVVKDFWKTSRSFSIKVPSQTYTFRLILADGRQFNCIAVPDENNKAMVNLDIRPDNFEMVSIHEDYPPTRIEIDHALLTPEERLLRAIFGDKEKIVRGQKKVIDGIVVARLWIKNKAGWQTRFINEVTQELLERQELKFKIRSRSKVRILELQNPDKTSQFIAVPASDSVECIIKKTKNPLPSNFYDVSLVLSNKSSQALIVLMNSGQINRGESFLKLDSAERLLQRKIQDPVGAAVGGYFLIKLGDLRRLHDWARNLADLFDWLPDGCVIYAWQLILEYESLSSSAQEANVAKKIALDRKSLEIRKYLLLSLTRGMPVFTEGVRLLYEGLIMCSYRFYGKDVAVEKALEEVRVFLANLDQSKETSTYMGEYPELPSKGSFGNRGLPPTGAGVALFVGESQVYINQVNTTKI